MCRYGLAFREVETRASRTELTGLELALGLTLVSLGLPALSSLQENPSPFKEPEGDLQIWWAQENVCVLVTTHLDDERNFQAAIVVIHAAAMLAEDTSDIVYDVVTSILHLASRDHPHLQIH
ncbi:hypothetical protein BOTBODRAFT_434461 [Botryobasidium botryosum FD-172 SS1]|uniref:Uncharacterized protein n=1 Tax=Botryobasidium botryosum (strain FD-172 SS1) TaxID=930990 RepID=A0A067N592_BOTB1|nr:hypothetical protein BOTBODRAFT_434461 [Botryobasidium botryosum FD-172 SS1]